MSPFDLWFGVRSPMHVAILTANSNRILHELPSLRSPTFSGIVDSWSRRVGERKTEFKLQDSMYTHARRKEPSANCTAPVKTGKNWLSTTSYKLFDRCQAFKENQELKQLKMSVLCQSSTFNACRIYIVDEDPLERSAPQPPVRPRQSA
eukprot:3705145-Amphidinium_carterae.1